MQNTAACEPNATAARHERKIIFLLCALAAIHVFIFCAAFPFFNNVDEPIHFDLIVKYSHGHLPVGKAMLSPDAATYLSLFSSLAYFGTPDEFPGGQMPPPPWTEPAAKIRSDLVINNAAWQTQENYEISQPPLYYTLTGFLWRIGLRIRADGGHLLYALRFFNVVLIVLLVLLARVTAQIIFPENVFMRLGVPALLAFMPQTAFYSLGNDILSPLCFGAIFLCLLKWLEKPSLISGAATGLAFAATWLCKTTNLPMLAMVAVVILFKLGQGLRSSKLNTLVPGLTAFIAFAGLPIILWMLWCKAYYGDFTGSKLKMEHFGWTVKPFGDWWHHPIFTPAGFWTYLSGQLSSFWQGEFFWHNQPLALPGSRAIYTIISLVLIIAALPALLPRSQGVTPSQRRALLISLLCFAAGLGFFALLSTVYDFHDCPNPSRAHPYFQAGRMILGALIPFLLLIVYGLHRLLARFGNRAKFSMLAVLILIMLTSEIAVDWPVFSNPFNWFHLP
jgi:hypothetical protein